MAWTEPHGTGHRGVYRDLAGTRHKTARFNSKLAAKQAASDQEARIREGTWFDPTLGQVTLAEYFEVWMTNRQAELNTRQKWRNNYDADRHGIGKTFGNRQLRRILTSDVQAWVARMIADDVSPGTIEVRFVTLQTILAARKGASALRDGLIPRNPCQGVQIPARKRPVVKIFEPAEVDALLDHLDPWWVPIPVLDAETGMRWGELMGLEVRDFTPGFRSVRVERVILEVNKEQTGNGTRFMVKDYPKEGPRDKAKLIALSADARTLVQAVVKARLLGPEDRLFSMPDKTPPPEWHPPLSLQWEPLRTDAWPSGLPISRGYFRTKIWKPAIEKAGVPELKFHALRASHISWLLAGGAALPDVMDRVGHTQFATTRRYSAPMQDADERTLSALDAVKIRSRTGHRDIGETTRRYS